LLKEKVANSADWLYIHRFCLLLKGLINEVRCS
jgi:hypothetical protein